MTTNTAETADSAARRFAHALERLREGLANRDIPVEALTPDALVDAALDAVDALRYERRLLGYSRLVLDLVAASDESRWPQARREAEDMAQRIVDEIGHPVTDEPALGPSFREQLGRLNMLAEWMRATGCGLGAEQILALVRDPRPSEEIDAAWRRTLHRVGCDCGRCAP